MRATNDADLQKAEEFEAEHPSAPLEDNGYPIYPSRGSPLSSMALGSEPILCDFGSSRLASPENKGWWMPDTYRAPEVLMGLPWGYSVDIWSIGVMVTRRQRVASGIRTLANASLGSC